MVSKDKLLRAYVSEHELACHACHPLQGRARDNIFSLCVAAHDTSCCSGSKVVPCTSVHQLGLASPPASHPSVAGGETWLGGGEQMVRGVGAARRACRVASAQIS